MVQAGITLPPFPTPEKSTEPKFTPAEWEQAHATLLQYTVEEVVTDGR